MLSTIEKNEIRRCLKFLEAQNKLMEVQVRGVGEHLLVLSSETLERANIDGYETALRILLSKQAELAARLIRFAINDVPNPPSFLLEEQTHTESILPRIP